MTRGLAGWLVLVLSFATVAQTNAAELYRRAIIEIQKAEIDPKTGKGIIPDGNYEDPKSVMTEEWARVISRSAVGLTLFEQGTQTPACQFNDKPAVFETELGVYGPLSYTSMINIVRAKGWQLVEPDPVAACAVALQLLRFSSHCATSRTQDGAITHVWLDEMAAEILSAAIANLPANEHAIARRFASELDKQLPLRMSNADSAASAEYQLTQRLQLAFANEATKNKAIEPAIARGIELAKQLLQPLRDNPDLAKHEFLTHVDKQLGKLKKVIGDTEMSEVLATGKGELLAATMVELLTLETRSLWSECTKRTKALRACRDQLRKLAGAQDPASAKQPNAAVLYRQAIGELQKALPSAEYEGTIELPEDWYEDQPDYTGKLWQQAVRKSAMAVTLFAQASQIPTCKFDAKVEDLITEFMSKAPEFSALRTIVFAHGLQQVANDPRGAGATAMQLLQHGNHCAQDRVSIAVVIGFVSEDLATKILQALTKQLASQEDGPAVAKRLLKQLDQHLAKRPTRLTLADAAEYEFAFILEHGLVDMLKSMRAKSAGERAAQIVHEMAEPLRKDAAITVEALRAHVKKYHDRARKLTKTNKLATILKNGTGETLTAVLVMLAGPDPSRLLEPFVKTQGVLQECRQQLVELAGK
ncbi:MAG: hypothetical protein ACI85K_003249 [Hyphomicrobiaceae bacterium]|jgi:hypothetical protein